MAQHAKHEPAAERIAIDELLSQFPITGRDRTWNRRPVVRRAFSAAHRVFDKHFKNKLRVERREAAAS